MYHNEPLEYNTVRLGLALMWQGWLLFLTTCHSLSISTLQIEINNWILQLKSWKSFSIQNLWCFLFSVLHHWTETYSNILTSVCGFGNCWVLGSSAGNWPEQVCQYCLTRCCNKVFTASSHEIGTSLTHFSLVLRFYRDWIFNWIIFIAFLFIMVEKTLSLQ